MDKINVLVVSAYGKVSERDLDCITAVDPSRVSLKDGRLHLLAELREKGITNRWIEILYEEEARIGRDPLAFQSKENLDDLLAETDILYIMGTAPDNLLARAPKLKWIHIAEGSVDIFHSADWFTNKSNIIITDAAGANSSAVVEHALGFVFALAKNFRLLLEIQKSKQWVKLYNNIELAGRTLGLIGLGTIGRGVAKRAKYLGMRVIATRRSATKRESGVYGIDELYPRSELHQLLSESDFLVITAPLTPETEGMIGEKELRVMKPTAYLINVARGKIIDQPTFIKALKEGWIAGAGLDVFETEPLPADNELWELPNVIVSCHMAGNTESQGQRFLDLFCDELRRYLAGEPLQHVIDTERKY